MSTEEKEAFLADVHVGVLALNEPGRGPLTVPVWYDYEPGGDLWFLTGKDSRKGRLIEPGTRVSLCAQTEKPPYRYVMVEGPVTAVDAPEGELEPMATRYLGTQMGKAYAQNAAAGDGASVVVRMRPERWLAVDYTKTT